jgi:hypothetical protein
MAGLGIDTMRIARRNLLVGIWAAEKLGLGGDSAKAYSHELAMAAIDVKRGDILATIRRDFDAADVVQSDEEILAIMNRSWLEAGEETTESSNATDGALVQIARNLMT